LSCFISPAWADSADTLPGCRDNVFQEHSGNFDAEDFTLVNTAVDIDGYLMLTTGHAAIDPNHIVIPFTQDVSVTFIYEEAGYQLSDFGWMLAEEGIDGTKHEIYQDINDNDRNGVLDADVDDEDDRYGDVNGDGVIDARDNKQVLGNFAGGTELVYYLKVDDEDRIFYTKKEWNQDPYTSESGECSKDEAGNQFTKTFYLGRPLEDGGDCTQESNWMAADAYARARDLFGLEFAYDDMATLEIQHDKPFDHVVVGAPGDKPNEWVLGWEDLGGGGDTDHNDLIFQIERETGGMAQLQPDKAVVPDQEDSYFTAVTIQVYDQMPCAGQTTITYELLHNDTDEGEGETLQELEITDWDEVYRFTLLEDGTKEVGINKISAWVPGAPEFTFRKRRVDLTGLGLSPDKLSWRAIFKSQEEACAPRVIGLSIDASVATHEFFSRSSPVVLGNVLYSGNYESPAAEWSEKVMRGHLVATRLYDPADPDGTATATIWDAGDVLNEKEPKDRKIKFPDITVGRILEEEIGRGDGTQETFSGTLSNHPLLATTISITDTTENFHDEHTDVLKGSLGGTGTINRFTGEFEITFDAPPENNRPIRATYSYYTVKQQLLDFNDDNVTNDMLGIDETEIFPEGLIYDFTGDKDVNEQDGKWLVKWVRGYKDGASTPKEWLLGPIDHSVPAGATPPGRPAWLFGTAITEAERESYQAYQNSKALRQTVVYVGARDGMLHAFDAGKFRHGDNDHTAFKEQRGYFEWQQWSAVCPVCPDYGTGEELWAFIPANLLPRLKNNLRKSDDQAYVDASPALADVFIDGQWKTVLLSAEGNGGDTVFCLDVTNPYDPDFLWEFADPDLFRSRSSPSVAQIGRIVDGGTTKWVAFFVSGKTYDTGLYPSIYMINIADGSVVRRIFLNADPGGIGGVPSGQPTIVDSDGNGYIDRIYIGSDKGRLYKINIPDNPSFRENAVNHCVINQDFVDDDFNEFDTEQRYHPIYGSPVAVVDNSLTGDGRVSYKIRLFYGTGDSPYYDENIDIGNTRYHFFAYRDENEKGQCDQSRINLDWFYELPAGHRIFSSAFAAAGNIYFGTSTNDTEDPCAVDGGDQSTINGGSIYALSMSGDLVRTENVGNIITSPLAVDEHLYVKSQLHGLQSFGGGPYNTPTIARGSAEFRMRNWREIF
jgi:hypothetical protein